MEDVDLPYSLGEKYKTSFLGFMNFRNNNCFYSSHGCETTLNRLLLTEFFLNRSVFRRFLQIVVYFRMYIFQSDFDKKTVLFAFLLESSKVIKNITFFSELN